MMNSPEAQIRAAPSSTLIAGERAEHQPAEQQRPQHGGVIERGDDRGRRQPKSLGHEDLRDPAQNADSDQDRQILGGRRDPFARHHEQPGDTARQGEIEHGRRRLVGRAELAHGDHRHAVAEGAQHREQHDRVEGARHRARRQDGPRKTETDRPHPSPAHLLAQERDRQQRAEQRRCERDRHVIGEFHCLQRLEAHEHRADTGDTPDRVPLLAPGLQGLPAALHRQIQQQWNQRRPAAEQDDLGCRIPALQQLDHQPHGREPGDRDQLHEDAASMTDDRLGSDRQRRNRVGTTDILGHMKNDPLRDSPARSQRSQNAPVRGQPLAKNRMPSHAAGAWLGAALHVRFDFVDETGDHIQPLVPERRIAGIQAERGQQFGVALGAAGFQHLEILLDEALFRVLVDRVERVPRQSPNA